MATHAPAPCPPPLPPYENQGSRTKTKDPEEHQTRERAPSALPWQDPAADLTTKAGRAKAYPATLPNPSGRFVYPDWFDAAWAARANQRPGDSKRAAWKIARKLVVDGVLTPDELLRRTESYAATEPAERQKFLQGFRRWFGDSVAEYEPTRITPTVSRPAQRAEAEEPDYDSIASPSDFAPGELESLIPFGRRSSAA